MKDANWVWSAQYFMLLLLGMMVTFVLDMLPSLAGAILQVYGSAMDGGGRAAQDLAARLRQIGKPGQGS